MQTIFNRIQGLRRVLVLGIISLGLWGMLSVGSAQAAEPDYQTNEIGSIQASERYDQIQSEAGGMNGFNDTDPRRNTAQANAKAKKLSDAAERRQVQADSPLDTAKEAISDLKDELLGD